MNLGLGLSLMLGMTLGRGSRVAPAFRSGLTDDGYGGWDWGEPGTYGLSDDGAGGWDWASSPDYRLNTTTLEWE